MTNKRTYPTNAAELRAAALTRDTELHQHLLGLAANELDRLQSELAERDKVARDRLIEIERLESREAAEDVKKTVYLIEELQTDSMENDVHLARYYVQRGFVEDEGTAKRIVDEAGVLPKKTMWAIFDDMPRKRYRALTSLGPASESNNRLLQALRTIRFAGRNEHPTSVWMQKAAAHAMEPDKWPDPGECA